MVTYTGLIQACLESGNIQDGAYIFEKMKDICSPNLVTCNMMLKAYLEHGMFQEAKELFEKMSENANHVRRNFDYKIWAVPDIYTFNTMLDACIAQKRWDYFDYVYQKMLYHGYHFNPKRHLRMILEASRAGKVTFLLTVCYTHTHVYIFWSFYDPCKSESLLRVMSHVVVEDICLVGFYQRSICLVGKNLAKIYGMYVNTRLIGNLKRSN